MAPEWGTNELFATCGEISRIFATCQEEVNRLSPILVVQLLDLLTPEC